jgi:hypothetical protein
MPVIAAVGDACVGNNISGVIVTGSAGSKVLTFPVARVTDTVLITGISPIPPIGGELVAVPIAFCPQPCLWFYIENGTIVASPCLTLDGTLQVACDGSAWVSPHFSGVVKATLGIPNMVL